VNTEVHRIQFISACAGRVKQICNRIFPEHNVLMTAPMTNTLSYKTFNQITPQAFSTLTAAVDDILLTEQGCIEVVQKISLASNADVWQVILQLSDELLRLHEICYLALQPFDQQHLLDFLPNRMWQIGFKLFCDCLLSHGQTGILYTFLDKAQSILGNFRTIAPNFELAWNSITSQLEALRMYLARSRQDEKDVKGEEKLQKTSVE
jgi:hypothetical protein